MKSIEAVQHEAAHLCKSCWDRELGQWLVWSRNWEPLQMGREREQLMLFFKISRGMVAIPMPSYVQPLYHSRTRQYHPARYTAVNCGTNVCKGSFFLAMIKLGNSLPPEVITQPNLEGFKAGLVNYHLNWFFVYFGLLFVFLIFMWWLYFCGLFE